MVQTAPRRSTAELRDIALNRAIQAHSTDTNRDNVLKTAKAFEEFLAGPAPEEATPAPASWNKAIGPVAPAAGDPWTTDPEVEAWRIDVERRPLDGLAKHDLTNPQIAYRIEFLANTLLADPHEDARSRQDALDELRATVADLPDVITDGAPAS